MEENNIKFTKRELEVLRLGGLPNRQIGLQLGLRYNTVRNHWANIYRKLGLLDDRNSNTKKIKALTKVARMGVILIDDIEMDPRRAP